VGKESVLGQGLTQLVLVVDLTIYGKSEGALGVEEGLCAVVEVDDGEAFVAEDGVAVLVDTVPVGTTVS
jgi:hypothetical protein